MAYIRWSKKMYSTESANIKKQPFWVTEFGEGRARGSINVGQISITSFMNGPKLV